MFIGNKKCRIYAACGVSQTPTYVKEREVGKYEEKKTKCSSKWIDDVCVIF